MTSYIGRTMGMLGYKMRSPFYKLTGGIMEKMGLDQDINLIKKRLLRLEEELMKMYEERKELRKRVPCPKQSVNVLDMILEDDQKRPEGLKWTAKEIAEKLILI